MKVEDSMTNCIRRLCIEAQDSELADAATAELETLQQERDTAIRHWHQADDTRISAQKELLEIRQEIARLRRAYYKMCDALNLPGSSTSPEELADTVCNMVSPKG